MVALTGNKMKKTAIILVNLGTPNSPTSKAIRHFLWKFLSDKRVVNLPSILWKMILLAFILPFRPQKLVHQYQSIWQKAGSPLEIYTRALAEKLQQAFVEANGTRSFQCEIYYAMAYSTPFLCDILLSSLSKNIDKLIVLPLYPQYSNSTTGAVFDQIFKTLRAKNNLPALKVMNHYHAHPQYIEALAKSVKDFWLVHGKPQQLILSFHGIPQRSVDEGDPYASQCEATAKALANALDLKQEEWKIVYQSRFGKARWLQPYCDKTLENLPQQGIVDVQIMCPGFSMDCLETLEEIAKTNQKIFLNAGGKSYRYIPCLNDSDSQIALMMSLLEESIT